MLKTLIALSGAVLLAAPSLHAQDRRGFAPHGGDRLMAEHIDRGGHGGRDGGRYFHGHGRYYYLGGVPYYYPFYDVGFGYPYYAYGLGYNEPYALGYGYGYSYAPYEGRIVNESAPGATASLPTEVQRQLAKKGYYKGSIDGEFGPASRSALSHFQRDNDLKQTGRIDEPTLEALGFSDRR